MATINLSWSKPTLFKRFWFDQYGYYRIYVRNYGQNTPHTNQHGSRFEVHEAGTPSCRSTKLAHIMIEQFTCLHAAMRFAENREPWGRARGKRNEWYRDEYTVRCKKLRQCNDVETGTDADGLSWVVTHQKCVDEKFSSGIDAQAYVNKIVDALDRIAQTALSLGNE